MREIKIEFACEDKLLLKNNIINIISERIYKDRIRFEQNKGVFENENRSLL